jgi:hypothetical protein
MAVPDSSLLRRFSQRGQFRAQLIDVLEQTPAIYRYGEKGCCVLVTIVIQAGFREDDRALTNIYGAPSPVGRHRLPHVRYRTEKLRAFVVFLEMRDEVQTRARVGGPALQRSCRTPTTKTALYVEAFPRLFLK